MAARHSSKTFEDALKYGLEAQLREHLAVQIAEPLVAEFKEKIEGAVRGELEKYTIGSVSHMRNAMKMSEDIHVNIHYKEKANEPSGTHASTSRFL